VALATFSTGNPLSPLMHSFYSFPEFITPELHKRLQAGGKHLELGCGVGGMLLSLLKAHPRMTATGIELDEAILKEIERLANELGVADRLTLNNCDARDYKADSVFDSLFWSQNFFERSLRSPVLEVGFRALKPGGLLMLPLLSEPPKSSEERRSPAGKAYTLNRLMYNSWGAPLLTPIELRNEVEEAGFEVINEIATPLLRYIFARKPALVEK
jgi:cyclopropane fatty-acyl-phospholipid synthase-like methyltransferase